MVFPRCAVLIPDLHPRNILVSFDPKLVTIKDILTKKDIERQDPETQFYQGIRQNLEKCLKTQMSQPITFKTGTRIPFKSISVKLTDFGFGTLS
jgi:hypothetical protein